MLILTRRVGEKIMIGEEMSVMVLGVKGRHVSLGIEAPADVNIVREELVLGTQKMTLPLKSKPNKNNVKKTTIITKRKKQIADQDLYCFSGLNG